MIYDILAVVEADVNQQTQGGNDIRYVCRCFKEYVNARKPLSTKAVTGNKNLAMVSKNVVTAKDVADNDRTTLNENVICQRIFEKLLEEVSQRITTLFNTLQNQQAEHIHKLLTLAQLATFNQFASMSNVNSNIKGP
ncbi:hypothetical protein ACOME3_000229 [Neoechinorhynchus agilis]